MKKIATFIFLLASSSVASALGPQFCTGSNIKMNQNINTCISTCRAIAEAGAYSASDLINGYGYCEGKAITHVIDIYKMELGKSDVSNPSRCTIWDGGNAPLSVNLGSQDVALTVTSSNPINLRNCPKGVEYDAIFLTTGRYERLSGEAVFPDDVTKKVVTTSDYKNIDSGHGINAVSDWRDTGFADATLSYDGGAACSTCYFKKLGASPSATDLSSSSPVVMYFDWMKDSFKTDTTTRSGFHCNPSDDTECEGISPDSSDRVVTIMPFTSSEFSVHGMPLTLKEGDETLDITWYKYRGIQDGTNEMGLAFWWYNDAGTLKYAGVKISEDAGYVVVSSPRKDY